MERIQISQEHRCSSRSSNRSSGAVKGGKDKSSGQTAVGDRKLQQIMATVLMLLAFGISMCTLMAWSVCPNGCCLSGHDTSLVRGRRPQKQHHPFRMLPPWLQHAEAPLWQHLPPDELTFAFELCNGFSNQKISLLTGVSWE